jgi:uncharacterized membrane protein YgcG
MYQREPSPSESLFWPVVWAVALHVIMFAMLFVSFAFAPDLPPAKPVVQATLYKLQSQSQATTQTNQKIAGELTARAEKSRAGKSSGQGSGTKESPGGSEGGSGEEG